MADETNIHRETGLKNWRQRIIGGSTPNGKKPGLPEIDCIQTVKEDIKRGGVS